MLNFNRPPDARDSAKSPPPLKPAPYESQGSAQRAATVGSARTTSPPPAAPREAPVAAGAVAAETHPTHAPAAATAAPVLTDAAGSKLFVGVNIKLKGVEISDCDALVIEGQVEATVHSKLMQVAAPGTLKGNAVIDVAEIHGEFSGELTARTRLVVHGTGRVSGTIRYGKLVVEEGGELSGDVKRLDGAGATAGASAADSRHGVDSPRGARSS